MCCKFCQNIFKVIVIVFFIITIGYYLKVENNLGAWFSFVLTIFFTLHLFETNIKTFKLGNLAIDLEKSINFNKQMGIKMAEIVLFLINSSSVTYQSKQSVIDKNKTKKDFKKEIIKVLSDFGYPKESIDNLKIKYMKESN